MQKVVIVDDISSNKRRKKVSDLLEGYGKRKKIDNSINILKFRGFIPRREKMKIECLLDIFHFEIYLYFLQKIV